MSDQPVAYNFPSDILEKLVCTYCSSYLSCGPVKVQSNGNIICGRCTPSSNEHWTPQILFEAAMRFFVFPCRYAPQGCKKHVQFNHAVEHEQTCPYYTVSCPSLSYGSCEKDVSVFDIYSHFDEDHSNLILRDGKFKLEFEDDIQRNLLMTQDNTVIIIQYTYDSISKTLYIDVRHFGRSDNRVVNFKLQIISGHNSNRVVTVKERQCDRYESRRVNFQSAETLKIENYLTRIGKPYFVYIHVTLVVSAEALLENVSDSTSSVVIRNLETETEEEAILNVWNELESVRCGYCHVFTFPPIYYTDRTHCCICLECKERQRCGAYQEEVQIPSYPCRWWGCSFIGNQQNIEDHVENCPFRTFICPLSDECEEGFYTANNLMEHMQRHGTFCPNPQKIVIKLFDNGDGKPDSKSYVYFTVLENKVIAFTCMISKNYDWHLMGNTENVNVNLYFQHDHCRFKSKTFTYTEPIDISYRNNVSDFPKCFIDCKRISVVLKIQKQN